MEVQGADRTVEKKLLAHFPGHGTVSEEAYAQLFRYFVAGWLRYRSPAGALAFYPGWRSWNGAKSDALEGFARMAPLLAAWVHGGRGRAIVLDGGHGIDLVDALCEGLVAGTDPTSSEYWGGIGDGDQRIVEAADIALAVWLCRDRVWAALTGVQRRQVVRWLSQVDGRKTPDNNWHLFVILVARVLDALGHPIRNSTAPDRYNRIRLFYRGDGWFRDGERGRFDYYNAWGFHYALAWLDAIDPGWDPSFLHDVQAAFLANYRYLIGPEGFPILGRSACYRCAAPAPLILGHRRCPDVVTAGQARRSLDCTWTYFLQRGAVAAGTLTQGYFGADARILENYSGPASCLWSLRSLIPAFFLPQSAPFWQGPPEPLPVEVGDYCFRVRATNWAVRGDRASRSITIEIPNPLPERQTRLHRYGLFDRFLGLVYRSPHRPENYGAKYHRPYYSSAVPFCLEARDRR